ncbi:hydroxymethylglutaryl-CoA lyase [Nocardioides sp. MAH-18]|uniref:Hydroxymethylglutaryl-CoA lyase n=1 Tax=Nocardioides agri TaxID=2682843 RepID=A0A6L6XMX2_9ACTN|nr:hydroxymethylglutaryl-CoA lyase [Nocardioides sp. MAH-18]MBA2953786.1 hydroxymethylglutaryl-CoA lyase [Nocardioides sp. CGMCC 1.13656]MVQ48651.1 hydroxymethylglutaryl-CoA lyase [Nocardioides sp. MAH-18]
MQCAYDGATTVQEVAVEIIEVGPRDGLQNEQVLVSTEDKIELISRSIDAGLRRIEATSFVHPQRVPQMADAEAVMAGVPRRADVSYIGLVLNRRGFDRALAAGVDEVNCVVVASETFSRRNQGMSVADSVQVVGDLAEESRAAGLGLSVTLATAFGCPFEGEVPETTVVELARQVHAFGVDEIALADTIGVGVPAQVSRLAGGVAAAAPGAVLRCHFHNTRNTGYANAVAALDAGVTVLDASTGGIGGCPFAPDATGNIATEDLVYLLDRSGVGTGVDLERLIGTARWLSGVLGETVPGQLARAGGFPAYSA